MSAKPVVKSSLMEPGMQDAAIEVGFAARGYSGVTKV